MRFSALLSIFLAARVIAQATPEPNPEPRPSLEPTRSLEPEATTSGPLTSGDFTASTDSKTTDTRPTRTSAPTAIPPGGGGGTCVHGCLAKAASQVGCRSIAEMSCTCNSGTYMNIGQECFQSAACPSSGIRTALRDYRFLCGEMSRSATRQSQSSRDTTSPTQTNTEHLTSFTTQTLVLTSGAVVTLPDGVATTIASEFTTIRTGQAGQLAGGITAATSPPSSGAVRDPGRSKWSGMGMMVGLGIAGGMLVLAV